MRKNNVKTCWAQGKAALCGWIATESPVLADDPDAVVVDLQMRLRCPHPMSRWYSPRLQRLWSGCR